MRKVVACLVCGALPLSGLPASVFARDSNTPVAAANPAANISPAEARALFQKAGISDEFIDDILIDKKSGGLSTIGGLLYRPMKQRYAADPGKALQEFGKDLNDRFVEMKKSNGGRFPQLSKENLAEVQKKLGKLSDTYDPSSSESNYQYGAQIEALLTGAKGSNNKGTVSANSFERSDGTLLISDAEGPVQIEDKNGRVLLNFKLRKRQHEWNELMKSGKPGVPPLNDLTQIPETGLYNRQTLQFPYLGLRLSMDEHYKNLQLSQIKQLIQLLGIDSITPDMMVGPKGEALLKNLMKRAENEVVTHRGRKVLAIDIFHRQWMELEGKLDLAWAALMQYKKDIDTIVAQFTKSPVLTEAQSKLLEKDQRTVQRYFRTAAILNEQLQVNNLQFFLDPDQPDFVPFHDALMAAFDDDKQKVAQFEAGLRSRIKPLHESTSRMLAHAKRGIESGDESAGSQAVEDALTVAGDRAFREFIKQVAPYHSTLSTAQALKAQVEDGSFMSPILSPIERFGRNLLAKILGKDSTYAKTMVAIEKDWAKMPDILHSLSIGKVGDARQAIIGLHPYATNRGSSVDPAEMTDAERAEASFREMGTNVALVAQTNGYVKVAADLFTWTAGLAVGSTAIRLTFEAGRLALAGSRAIGVLSKVSNRFPRTAAVLGFLPRTVSVAGEEYLKSTAASLGMVQQVGGAVRVVRGNFIYQTAMAFGRIAYKEGTFLLAGGVSMGLFSAAMDYAAKGEMSPYQTFGDAFVEGFKGAILSFGSGLFPLLPFAGLPYTAVQRIPGVAKLFEFLAHNALSGVIWGGGKWALRGVLGIGSNLFQKVGLRSWAGGLRGLRGRQWLATAEELREKHIYKQTVYEKLQGHGGSLRRFAVGQIMSIDHLARFIAMNEIGKLAAFQYGLRFGRWSDEEDAGQRLKGAQQASRSFEQSLWWMLIPQASAYEASRNMSAQRAMQGAMLYEKKGQLKKVLAAEEPLPFLDTQSWWEKLSDPFPRGDTFEVNDQVRDWARGRALLHELGGKNSDDVHFMDLYRVTKIRDGDDDEIGLRANAELRAAANIAMIEAMLRNEGLAKKFLDENNIGTDPDGSGRLLTEEIQETLAFAVLAAPNVLGRAASKSLRAQAEAVLKPYVESAKEMEGPAIDLADRVEKAKSKSDKTAFQAGMDAFQQRFEQSALGDRNLSQEQAMALLRSVADGVARDHALDPAAVEVIQGIVRYIESSYSRFNFANNVPMVSKRLSRTVSGLKRQFNGNREVEGVIESWEGRIGQWVSVHQRDRMADDISLNGGNPFRAMLADLRGDVDRAGLPKAQADILLAAADTMGAAPWVVRNAKGKPIPGWRTEQLIGLVQVMSGFAGQRVSGAKSARVYQLMATGTGKTLTQFVGMLPLVEQITNDRNIERLVYITIPALKAQAVNDFLAFKVARTGLEFSTPEDIKAKIAEGKLNGTDPMSKIMLIGDEADKFLFEDPQTSLGGVTGTITRVSSVYSRIEERTRGLLGRLDFPRVERVDRISAATRRALDLIARKHGEEDSIQNMIGEVRHRLSILNDAKGEDIEAVEADLFDALDGLRRTLRSLTPEIDQALSQAAAARREGESKSWRSETLAAMRQSFRRNAVELRLLGSAESRARLARESLGEMVELEARLAELDADIARHGGSEERLAARESLVEINAMHGRFVPESPEARVALLQEQIIEAENAHRIAEQQAMAMDEPIPGQPRGLAAWRQELARLRHNRQFSSNAALASRADAHEHATRRYNEAKNELIKLEDQISEAMRKNSPDRMGLVQSHQLLSQHLPDLRRAAERAHEELAGGDPQTDALIRKQVGDIQEQILSIAQESNPGWESRVEGLVAAYDQILRSYGGDENPVYTEFRRMQDSMRSLAYRPGLYGPTPEADAVALARHELEGGRAIGGSLRLLTQALLGLRIDPGAADVGLTRLHAANLLRAIRQDPAMSVNVKGELFWPLVGSILFPRRQNGWVHRELRNQFSGFLEDPTSVYNNPRNGQVMTRFNGQVIENMDIETRRYWELRTGADLTLPYEHKEVGGARDIIDNKNANYFLFSATIEDKAKAAIREKGVAVLGEVEPPHETPAILPTVGESGQIAMVEQAVAYERNQRDFVTMRRSDLQRAPPEHRAALEAHLASHRIADGERTFNIDLSAPEFTDISRQWIRDHSHATYKNQKGLVTVFCSNTNALKRMRARLIQRGVLNAKEISTIFSDVQYENAHGDARAIEREMNLGAMKEGRTRVLLIDSSYVIRGIDLDFKGADDDFNASDPRRNFAGYNHNSMLFFGADENTKMQIVQGAGRTAPRRVLPGLQRSYTISFDIQAAETHPVFRRMVETDRYRDLRGRTPAHSWEELDAYVRAHGDATLREDYQNLLRDSMGEQWQEVSDQKLEASGFSKERRAMGRFPGIQAVFGSGR